MAKTPPRKPRRTVKPIDPALLQPGTIGAELTAKPDGIPVVADVEGEQTDQDAELARLREAFLATARARYQRAYEAESQLRKDMLDDLRFYNSDQWPDNVKADRLLDQRPLLTINRLPQFVRQVMNQARRSRPAIQINPVDNGADPQTAEVIQGLCRNIETNSKAPTHYSTAGEHQVIMGRGYLRVRADYAADDSFEQEILIEAIEDPFTVYPDPAAGRLDYSDSTFTFIIEKVPRDEYLVRYGEDKAQQAAQFTQLGDTTLDWYSDAGIQVAEYYYIESVRARIADCIVLGKRVVLDRSVITAEDLAPSPTSGQPRVQILKERDTVRRQLKWSKINGVEILEGNDDLTAGRDLPGPYIPVVPMLGEKLVVDGRKNLRGMVRDAKDPQRAYNFWVSAETEMIALAPRSPVIGAAGQFEGHEAKWRNANRRNYAYLEYNPVDLNGQLVPPPQRAAFDPNVGPIIQATMQADRDLKSVIGLFDASQERSPEQSGKAIIARQQQGEEGNSHYLDNQSRAIEHIGRILVHWIPVYYDKPRMLRIIGLDEQPKNVVVHVGNEDAAQSMFDEMAGDPKVKAILMNRPFDVGIGRYDVTVTVGPSYQSRRQESVEALIQLVQAYPAVLPVVGDILVGNMDWPGAQQLAERLKRMVPQEARDPDPNAPDLPPEVQQQLDMLSQNLQMAMQALDEKDRIIQTKAQELAAQSRMKQLELASQERETAMRTQAELTRTLAQIRSQDAIAVLEAQLKEISQRLEHAHEEKMAATSAREFMPPQKPVKPAKGGRPMLPVTRPKGRPGPQPGA